MSDDEIERIRARLDTHGTDLDRYEGLAAEPHPRIPGALRGTQERDALIDLRTLLAALDASQREAEQLRRRIESTPPWPDDRQPLDDEQMRALMLRWSTGPEQYQADADALIATTIAARAEAAQLRDFADRVRIERDHAAEVETPTAIAEARDQARRAAIEEAVRVCEAVESAQTYGSPISRLCIRAIRALLDAPAPEAT